MSSFYDDASLVVIPSGYKTSKIYAEKPTDGSGDLTFTRASNATRVASNGLIEKVRTNLATYSEDFTNAAWNKYQVSVTGNSVVAPDGTTTADTITDSAVNDVHVAYQGMTYTAGEYSVSCYVKANTLSHSAIYVYDGANFFISGIFNLSNGTVSGAGSIVSAGNGWYRISFTTTIASGTGYFYIGLSNGTTISYSGTGQSIYAWGYQLETGVATDYIPTTTAAVSVGPVSNVPRLDYLGSTCPRLLLEPQRTNVITYSEQFNNAAWNQFQTGAGTVSVIANAAVSPDGYQNADEIRLTRGALTQDALLYQANSVSNATYSRTIYLKAARTQDVGKKIDLWSYDGTNTVSRVHATLTADWVRFDAGTATGALQEVLSFGYLSSSAFPTTSGTDVRFYAWGAQGEAGAYATSYIPTLGASVTRVADAGYKTGVSSLIGQTEGVLYAEVQNTSIGSTSGSDNVVITIEGANFNDVVGILYQPFGTIYGLTLVGGALQTLVTANVGTTSAFKKIAFAYKANDFALYVDGVQVGTDTSGTVPTCSNLGLGQYYNGGSLNVVNSKAVKQALVFKTRLTNAQLAELTTI